MSLYSTSQSLPLKHSFNKVLNKSVLLNPIKSSRPWKEINQIPKLHALQHIKINFPKVINSINVLANSIFESEFQFSNPNFSHEIAVSLFESELKFSIPISVMKSQFHYLNLNLSFQLLISVTKSKLHYLNPILSFKILMSVMTSQLHFLNPNFSFQILIFVMKL